MQRQRSIPTFEDQIATDKVRLEAQIALLPDGRKKDELLKKIRPTGFRRRGLSTASLMHEKSNGHYQYRQCAKADHYYSKSDVRHETLPKIRREQKDVSQSPMVA